jgi:hypothetical protein
MFQISALRYEDFADLFSADDGVLARRGARRYVADARPGFPCRVSLQDAEVGERLVLVPFCHQPAGSPYQASGPIFVREQAVTAVIPPDTVPGLLRSRLLSVRAYGTDHLMTGADVVDGRELEPLLARFFERGDVSYVHVHFARPGCYACRVDRTGAGTGPTGPV